MARPLVPDDLWAAMKPLLPPARPRPRGGRPPISDRAALTGILFVLKSGLPWEMLPAEMGCGSVLLPPKDRAGQGVRLAWMNCRGDLYRRARCGWISL
jgi:transposase